MRSAIFVVVMATALVYNSIVVKAASEERSNFPEAIQGTTVESAVQNMKSNLRGLRAFESDTTGDEERGFSFFGRSEKAVAVTKAKELIHAKASMKKFVEENIRPEILFKALGLKSLGSNGKMEYAQYKALSGEERRRVVQIVNSDETLVSKTNMLQNLEWAWRGQ